MFDPMYAGVDKRDGLFGFETFAEQLPSDGTCGHLESQISRAVHQFEDGVGSVVSWTVTELVYPSVASRSLGVSLC
jgi:hypothetical protein